MVGALSNRLNPGINKVYLRRLMAEVVVTWIKYNKATGLNRLGLRRHLEDTLNLLADYFSRIPPYQIQSRVWKQAYKIAMKWQQDKKLSRRQMSALITISLEKSIR